MQPRVWVTFRHAQVFPLGVATVVDKLAEWLTGGSEVHCEFVLELGGTLCTYGALVGVGVFSSTVKQDSAYRSGRWTWIEVTSLFKAQHAVLYLHQWLEHTLGAKYGTLAMLAFAVPFMSGADRKKPKQSYICSELLADALLNCCDDSGSASVLRHQLVQHCGGDTSLLSPVDICSILRQQLSCRVQTEKEVSRLISRAFP